MRTSARDALIYPANTMYPGTVEGQLNTAEQSKPDEQEQKTLETVETPAGTYAVTGKGDMFRLMGFVAVCVVLLSLMGFISIEDTVDNAVSTVKEVVKS